MAEISIIIPCYNYAHFLVETLDSVKKQNFSDWECLVVNDGSTDNTEEICIQYCVEDSRFKYLYQNNQGLSSARNTGIKNAKGKYIQFLDSDDLISNNKLEKQVAFMETYPEWDMVISSAKYFNEQNTWDFHIDLPIGKVEKPFSLFLKKNRIPVSAPLLRTSVIKKTGLFDKKLRSLEDWQYWLRFHTITERSFFGNTEMGFTSIREHAKSMKRDSWRMDFHHFLIRDSLHHITDNVEYLKINNSLKKDILKTLAYSLCKPEIDYTKKIERLTELIELGRSPKLLILRNWLVLFKNLPSKLVWFLFGDAYLSICQLLAKRKYH